MPLKDAPIEAEVRSAAHALKVPFGESDAAKVTFRACAGISPPAPLPPSALKAPAGAFRDVHAADAAFTGAAPLQGACPEGALEGI
ncbi:hypothetical protein GCM10009754_38120 [Amycolatopsis minnesotensis]|uniref:Uncharacterized protein n=1 Tax=Amycolatopsis minnesotensis TaxID=337894 RepID=A0ABP5CFY0_9PSEU